MKKIALVLALLLPIVGNAQSLSQDQRRFVIDCYSLGSIGGLYASFKDMGASQEQVMQSIEETPVKTRKDAGDKAAFIRLLQRVYSSQIDAPLMFGKSVFQECLDGEFKAFYR